MSKRVATLGYGYHLPETRLMLDLAAQVWNRERVRAQCIHQWPQASETNKAKMWNHLSRRYLETSEDEIVATPFLRLYAGLTTDSEKNDLTFFQLCRSTRLLIEVLRSLARDALLDTGSATFTKFHLDQILTSLFGHVTKSTSERVRQILREAGRLTQEGTSYTAVTTCPADAVLGFGIYADAERQGWRAPSTAVVVADSDITASFLCSRSLLISGVRRLSQMGHCEYHTQGATDQVQLVHRNLEEFVDAWLG